MSLDGEEDLLENDSLRKDLEEANHSIVLLKQVVSTLQCQVNDSNNVIEIGQLVKQIEDSNKAVLSLQKEIETKNKETAEINAQLIVEKKGKKRSKRCCFLLLALLAIVGTFLIVQSDELKHKNSSLETLRKQNVVLNKLGDSLSFEIKTVQNSYDSLLLKYDSLSTLHKQLMTKYQRKSWERATKPQQKQPNQKIVKKIVVQPEPILESRPDTKPIL